MWTYEPLGANLMVLVQWHESNGWNCGFECGQLWLDAMWDMHVKPYNYWVAKYACNMMTYAGAFESSFG